MRALQLHYTSCRRGLSGSSGFQTRALTPGIQPDEQREIERRGIYRPPRDAHPEPTREQVARDFPKALRCYRLESGRCALTRSSYAGQDYSGRWGNFFAHTLVVENGTLPPLWPVDYYEWEGWRDRLEIEDEGEQSPPPLPMADLGAVEPAESFRLAEIQEFLREDPQRPALLAKIGRALLLGRETSRALVIRDTPTHGLFWVAALQKLFPARHAWRLTCSTYQDDPRGCAEINATTGETDFRFDESERRFRFYMFDLSNAVLSEVPDSEDDYPAIAAGWLAREPGTMAEFWKFMDLFEHDRPEPDLISAIHLFQLSLGQPIAPAGRRLSSMIDFASRHARPEARVRFLEILGGIVALPEALGEPEDYRRLLSFFAQGARATGRLEHRRMAFAVWSALLREHLVSRHQGLDVAAEGWSSLRQELAPHTAELSAELLAEPLWRDLRHRLPDQPCEVLAFLLRITRECLEETGRTPFWQQPEIEEIVAAMLGRAGDTAVLARPVLEMASDDPQTLAAMAQLAARVRTRSRKETDPRDTDLDTGRALAGVLRALPAETSRSARLLLEAEEAWHLLFGEWVELCEGSEDPLKSLEAYKSGILRSLPAYERQCAPWVATTALRRLPDDRRGITALAWLRQGATSSFPVDLARECAMAANTAVPLDPESREGDEAARLVSQEADRLGFVPEPDRPRLRRSLAASTRPGTLKDLALDEAAAAVSSLEETEHGAVIRRLLPAALERAVNSREHHQVLAVLTRSGCSRTVLASYLDFFKAGRRSAWPEPLQAALRFWLSLGRNHENTAVPAELERTAREGLLLSLGRLSPKQIAEVEVNLRRARLDDSATGRWQALVQELEKRKRGPLARIAGFFRGN